MQSCTTAGKVSSMMISWILHGSKMQTMPGVRLNGLTRQRGQTALFFRTSMTGGCRLLTPPAQRTIVQAMRWDICFIPLKYHPQRRASLQTSDPGCTGPAQKMPLMTPMPGDLTSQAAHRARVQRHILVMPGLYATVIPLLPWRWRLNR